MLILFNIGKKKKYHSIFFLLSKLLTMIFGSRLNYPLKSLNLVGLLNKSYFL
jgi:hypothetical protein